MVATTKKPKTKKLGRPSLGTEDDFRRFGGLPHRGEHGWLEYYAKQPLDLSVKKKHIEAAVPRSTTECTFGIAGSDYFDNRYVIEVGCTVFRVIDDVKKKRLTFRIPAALRRRLRLFDNMSFWDLPPAIYRLYPMPKPKKKRRQTANSVRNMHIENNQVVNGRVRKKAKKAQSSPTRIINRGKIVKWSAVKTKTRRKK